MSSNSEELHIPVSEDEVISVGSSSPPWMVTYSDLVTQLLIFFVMMFALSSTLNELQLSNIKKRLEKYLYENKYENMILLEINPKGLVISLSEKIMFDSGKAEIYEEAKNVLAAISKEIVDIPNNVRIEGHTDSVPIKTDKFPSNWELSTARATNIARFLIENLSFPPSRISAGGYSQYHPAVTTEYDAQIIEYKNKVRDVPSKYIPLIDKAKTEADKNKLNMQMRDEQMALQVELQGVIENSLETANETDRMRAMNRRVDIIVERMSSSPEKMKEVLPQPDAAGQ